MKNIKINKEVFAGVVKSLVLTILVVSFSQVNMAQGVRTSNEIAITKKAIEAGPIWNQSHAEARCPIIAAEQSKDGSSKWTGQWWTTVWGSMSVCEVNVYNTPSPPVAINGYNARLVVFKSFNGGTLGSFRQTGMNTWSEDGVEKANRFQFEELNRDEWSVYLYDSSRDVHIQLDLWTKKVMYNAGSEPRQELYNVSSSYTQAIPNWSY